MAPNIPEDNQVLPLVTEDATFRHVKVPQPKHYNGSRNFMVLENWIFSVDRYFSLIIIPTENQVLFMSTLLEGEALLWFRSNYKEETYKTVTWKDVKEQLKVYFAPPNQDRRLADK